MFNRRNFLTGGIAATSSISLSAMGEEKAKTASDVKGYNYKKPVFKKGMRIVFQGDSITDMKWGRNQADKNHYLGHSYVYLIASRLGLDLAHLNLDILNRGHSGNKVSDLKNRWKRDAVDLNPDIISILIGTNDVGQARMGHVDMKLWESNYRSLLEDSRKKNPDVIIVLLDPFIVQAGFLTDAKQWSHRRPQIDQMGKILTKLAAEFKAIHVKTQEVFDQATTVAEPAHWIWDGIHPMPQGHELIARNWIQQVSQYLK